MSCYILDFGSQYTRLIARSLRRLGYKSEVLPLQTTLEEVKRLKPQAVILSGSPHSVFEDKAYSFDVQGLINNKIPFLGICYGMQLICHELGGKVKAGKAGEYGPSQIIWSKFKPYFLQGNSEQKVWMSHGDEVVSFPEGCELLASSKEGVPAILQNLKHHYMTFQFHPEVSHTEKGLELLKYFLEDIACLEKNWNEDLILKNIEDLVCQSVGEKQKVLCALSGGVDSTVMAVLLSRVLKAEQMKCFMVNTGLLRLNEAKQVKEFLKTCNVNVEIFDGKEIFLKNLKGVVNPEEKRKIIGRTFVDCFKKCVNFNDVDFLAQGTLYPDVIESFASDHVVIKTHHNVGGLPEELNLKLLEPFRFLFKDEVRQIGACLNVPKNLVQRHPFPGPGLGVRILGEVTEEKVSILQQVDHIFITELKRRNFYDDIWQAFAVLLPIQSVGVQGDKRAYKWVVSLRAIISVDGMTAKVYDFPEGFLQELASTLVGQVSQIGRVVYDVTSKPPATIEWE